MSAAIDADTADVAPRPRRRLWLGLAALLVLAWLAYAVSPVIAAARLLQAARAGDQAGVAERVSFPRLRRSIARQIVADALRRRDIGGADRQLAASAATALLAAALEELISPKTLVDLLSGRAIMPSNAAPALDLSNLRLAPAKTAFAIWRRSGFTGIASYAIVIDRPAPQDSPPGERLEPFRLGLELNRLSWRVESLTLPTDLREELVRRASQASKPQS
jgi:hypothetical protein